MKTKSIILVLSLAATTALACETCSHPAKSGECTCCKADAKSDHAASSKTYPLKGVIVEIQADQNALTVKHEAIPGLMPAMTMLFKVEPAALKSAAKGQTITATLIQKDGEFWLNDVKPATETK